MTAKDATIEFLTLQVAALQAELERVTNPQTQVYSIPALVKYDLCNQPINEQKYGN